MNRGGIRQRLLLLTLVPALLFLLMVIGYFGQQGVSKSEGAMKERGVLIARYLANMAEFAVATGNMRQLRELSGILLDQELTGFRVYDTDDNLLITLGKGLEGVPSTDVHPVSVHHCGETQKGWLFCAPIVFSPQPIGELNATPGDHIPRIIGRLEASLSSERLKQERQQVVINSLLTILLMMLLMLYLIRRVEQEITQPLVDLTHSVSLISDGANHVQITADGRGEIRSLQQGFNTMARTLDRHYAEMEHRIEAATEKLNHALLELEEKNHLLNEKIEIANSASKAKSLFLATMSHEIRTPLSGIIGMLSLLDRQTLPEVQRSYIDHMEQATSSLRMLIDDVLDFSRIEAGKLRINQHVCFPQENVEGVVMMLAHSAQKKNLELILEIDPSLPKQILGDELRFRQILINLVGNAIKFTEQGYVMVRVQAKELDLVSCRIRTEIIDSGIGIDPQVQGNIFEGFTQIDTSMTRQHGGSGLGTTIARELVKLMGGTIGLQSAPGEGSCFWFELEARVIQSCNSDKPLQGKHYLLFERCDITAQSLIKMMQAQGATVERYSDDGPMVQCYTERSYDAVLLCENSQEFSTQNLAKRLYKAAQPLRRSPVYHVTYINGQSDAKLFGGYITKPLTPGRLANILLEPVAADDIPKSPNNVVPLRVLLAEDDRINATVVSSFLGQLGHRVQLVADGEAALSAMRQGGLDMAILDLRMPLVDGLTVCQQWREHERREGGGHLPIVALTANASEEDRAACMAAGMDEFLTKPVTLEQLDKILRQYEG